MFAKYQILYYDYIELKIKYLGEYFMKRFFIILMVLLFAVISSNSIPISNELKSEILNLNYLTENYYPHNYEIKGVLKGMSVDVLYMIWNELGITDRPEIKVYTWKRALTTLEEEKSIVLFGMGKTADREKLGIQFVSSYYVNKIIVIGKIKDGINKLNDLQELKGKTIVAINDDIGHKKLGKAGINESNAKMNILPTLNQALVFFNGRDYQYFATTLTSVENLIGRRYYIAYTISIGYSSYGFSQDVNPEIVRVFQAALDKLKRDGKVKMVVDNYMKK